MSIYLRGCHGRLRPAQRSAGACAVLALAVRPPPPAPQRCVAARTARKDTGAEESEAANSIAEFAAARRALNAAIDSAARREDYSTAAQLKRELDRINAEDPFYLLTQELEACVKEERFQDAARLQARIRELEASIGASPLLDPSALSTSSEIVTNGIRVCVESTYRVAESAPSLGQYFFSYHIKVTNESDKVVQLKNRHWIIRDSSGKVDEVRGPGVVGVQPILLPGKTFEYDSACPLRTPSGSMEGEYEMWVLSEEDGEFKSSFQAAVGRFGLQGPTQ